MIILFETIKVIGYIQLYLKIVGSKEIYYAKFDGDFSKPITWFKLQSIKRKMKKFYSEFDIIYSVQFCNKEEYDKNNCGDELLYNWESKKE